VHSSSTLATAWTLNRCKLRQLEVGRQGLRVRASASAG
jgi:hypothetical protein